MFFFPICEQKRALGLALAGVSGAQRKQGKPAD
jgi:hypothetical protein